MPRAAENVPGSGAAPIGGGTGTYGSARPDVAAYWGAQFLNSGYTKTHTGLPAGPHQLYVSSHSTVSGAWTSVARTLYIDSPTTALTIDRGGTGTGGITATGLSCPGGSMTQAVPCAASYPLHTAVTLVPAPDPGSTFSGWSGACTGTGTCQVTMSSAKFVSAAFAKTPNSIATRYYHTDVVGSVRAITDETGAVVLRHDYRPFGEDTQPLAGDPNRFAGKQLDAETAMHYFDARYYRQTWGRFSTVDPLMVGAAMTDPQQWNRYAYAKNNPLAWGDPTGLQGVPTFRSGVDVCANGGIPPLCAMGSGGAGGAPGMTSGNATPPSGTCEGLNGYGDFYLWVPCAGDDTVGQGSSAAWVSVCAMYPSLPKCQTAPPDTGGTPDGGDPGGDNDDDELPECDGPFCEIARDIDKRIGAAAHLTTWMEFYSFSASNAAAEFLVARALVALLNGRHAYTSRVFTRGSARDMGHSFPMQLDGMILNGSLDVDLTGYHMYRAKGFLNNREGVYELGGFVRHDVLIVDHRAFIRAKKGR